jgi:hypothetical protein
MISALRALSLNATIPFAALEWVTVLSGERLRHSLVQQAPPVSASCIESRPFVPIL